MLTVPLVFQALALTLPCLTLPVSEVSAETRTPWTILVYGGADNNADGPILNFLDDVRKAIDDDAGIDMVLLIDRSEEFSDDATLLGEDFTGTRLYRLRRDSAERLSGGSELSEIGLEGDVDLDSGDPDLMKRFIAWGKQAAPAENYALLIYSHANGRTMCPDDASGTSMTIPEFSAAATEAESVDFMALELCNMGGIEIAYEWRPAPGRFGADVLVAIPNAGPPLDWDRAFRRIRTPGHDSPASEPYFDPATMTAADFGKLVVDEGYAGRLEAKRLGRRVGAEAAACYDLAYAKRVKKGLDRMARALATSTTADGDGISAKELMLEMRGPGPIGDAMNYSGGGAYVDLYDLCMRVEGCDGFSPEVREAASVTLDAVERMTLTSFGMDDYPDFEQGRHGIFVVLPGDFKDVWREFSWYTPLAGDPGGDFGNWAALRDGATPDNGIVENWFELLDAWYDPELEDGGINGYRW